MNLYDVEIYFPNGELCAKHESVKFAVDGWHGEGVEIIDPQTNITKNRYAGMIWIAESVEIENFWGYNKGNKKNTARITGFGGQTIREFKNIFLSVGSPSTLWDDETGRLICYLSGPIEVNEQRITITNKVIV